MLKVVMEMSPPVKGDVSWGRTDHEGAPPSGIEVVNAVEDLAHDQFEGKEEEPREVDPPAIVKDNKHPNISAY
jgi:hypothetical protein